jgi:hypothetical protein
MLENACWSRKINIAARAISDCRLGSFTMPRLILKPRPGFGAPF